MVDTVDLLLILVVILIVVLIWRGPQMLPQIGEALGRAVKGARDNMGDDGGRPADGGASTAGASPDRDRPGSPDPDHPGSPDDDARGGA
jgi:hypothetical protein